MFSVKGGDERFRDDDKNNPRRTRAAARPRRVQRGPSIDGRLLDASENLDLVENRRTDGGSASRHDAASSSPCLAASNATRITEPGALEGRKRERKRGREKTAPLMRRCAGAGSRAARDTSPDDTSAAAPTSVVRSPEDAVLINDPISSRDPVRTFTAHPSIAERIFAGDCNPS